MELVRTSKYWNPFSVVVNNKCYELDNIHVYNNEGVIISTGCGWFGSNNNVEYSLIIEGECKLKKKIDFSKKDNFIIKGENTYNNRYELYIYCETIQLSEPAYKKYYDFIEEKRTSNNEKIFFSKHHFINSEVWKIENEIRTYGEKIEKSFLNKYKDIPTYTKELNKLYKKRLKAIEKMNNYSIEDFKKEKEGKNHVESK